MISLSPKPDFFFNLEESIVISYTAFENQINIYEERLCMYIYIEIMHRESKTFPESESHFCRVHLLHQESIVIFCFCFCNVGT